MAAGEGDHAFLRVHGEVFHLFREVPQADDVRLPGQHLIFHIEEDAGKRLPGEAAAPKADIVIAAEDIQHRGAVVHGITLHRQRILLRLVAAQYEEQVAAILLVQVFPGAVFHRQVIGRDHNHRVFEIGRGFDLLDKRRDVFLAAAYRAEGEVLFTAHFIAFSLTGAGNKTVRMVGVHR